MLDDLVTRFSPEGSFFRTGNSRSLLNTSLNTFTVGDSYTVAAWVKFNSLPSGSPEDIVRLFPANNDNDILRLGLSSTAKFEYTASTSGGVVRTLAPAVPAVEIGRWYHIIGCKLSNAVMRLFINGVDVETTFSSVPLTADAARKVSIGIDGRDSSGQLDADIHSVALWNTPISEESVRAIYNGGYKDLDLRIVHPCYDEAANLQHWWRFGQGATTIFSAGNDFSADWVRTGGISITEEGGDVDDEDILLVDTGSRGTALGLDGSVGSLSSSVAVPIGIANAWSISIWIKPLDLSVDQSIICFCDNTAPSFQSAIQVSIEGTSPNTPLRVLLNTDNAPATEILREVDYDDALTISKWQHLFFTWDGSVVKTYLDSVLLVLSGLTSNPGVQSDNSRFVDLGADSVGGTPANFFNGLIGHTAVWNVVMEQDAICQIFSGGNCLDLRYNKDAYRVAENLKRYWKPGEDTTSPGRDFTDLHKPLPIALTSGTPDIVGESPSVLVEIFPSGPQPIIDLKAVDVIGVFGTEYFANNTVQSLGYANAWTWAFWIKNEAAVWPFLGNMFIMHIRNGFNGDDEIFIREGANGTNTKGFTVQIRSSTGILIKDYDFFVGWPATDIWNLYVLTWDGTNMRWYINAAEITATATPFDSSGTMADQGMQIHIAGRFDGLAGIPGIYHSAALWNVALDQSNVNGIFAGTTSIDWLFDQGTYDKSANLKHYWRLGLDSADAEIGRDYKGIINISDNAVDITSADVITDSPGV